MLGKIEYDNNICVLEFAAKRLSSDLLVGLKQLEAQCMRRGAVGLVLDFSKVPKLGFAAIAALVEFYSTVDRRLTVGFCELGRKSIQKLHSNGLDEFFPIHSSVTEALESDAFTSTKLSGVTCLVLCAGKGSRMHPLTMDYPKPMLPFLGKPVLHHILNHLQRFGASKVLLNPGHLGPQIHDYFAKNANLGQSVFYLNEGSFETRNWEPRLLGSASTIKKFAELNSAFQDDFFVLCGDALTDINLGKMLDSHRSSGAEVTIAAKQVGPDVCHKYGIMAIDDDGRLTTFQEKPAPSKAVSNLANTGIYIFNRDVVSDISSEPEQDIANHLLPKILNRGGHINVFQSTFDWIDIGCGKDYATGLALALNGRIPNVFSPNFEMGHRFGNSSFQRNQVFIDDGGIVEKGAKLKGPVTIGKNAIVERGAFVSNSHIMPNTRVESGAIIEDMIVSSEWAINHKFADGTLRNTQPLDCVSNVISVGQDKYLRLA